LLTVHVFVSLKSRLDLPPFLVNSWFFDRSPTVCAPVFQQTRPGVCCLESHPFVALPSNGFFFGGGGADLRSCAFIPLRASVVEVPFPPVLFQESIRDPPFPPPPRLCPRSLLRFFLFFPPPPPSNFFFFFQNSYGHRPSLRPRSDPESRTTLW